MSTEPTQPQVYIILGASGSGRREVVADLIEGGLPADGSTRSLALVARDEPPDDADARLGPRQPWQREGDTILADVPEGTTHVFFFTDGRANPVDQLEALKPWIAANGLELARVLCVVHCRLAEANPPLLTWYDACIHFSDVALLHQREGVANKWISDFRGRYEAKFLPCHVELVKQGRVKNPVLLLEPQARRISHYFDDEVDWVIDGAAADAPEDEDAEDGEVTAAPEVDPYLERRAGGRRVKEIPDIASFLPAPAPSAPAP